MSIKIILSDGTTLENLSQNGNLYISEVEIDKSVFDDNLSPMTIDDGETKIVYENAELCYFADTIENDTPIWTFSIRDISDKELRLSEGLKFIAELLLTDAQAYQALYLFDDWNPNGVRYTKDISKVQYNGELWKCLKTHDSQLSWNPEDANSLWVRIDDPAEEWPEWRQPTGSTDAYSKGDKVSHDGKHWISNVDGTNTNTWEPGVFGWDEQPSDE